MHIHTLTIIAVVFLLAGAVKGMIGPGCRRSRWGC